MREKIALPLEGVPSVVLLNNGERMSRVAAKKAGYTIHGEADAPGTETRATIEAHQAWCASILLLPEARDRAAAAAAIVNEHTAATMTAVAARAFLRGLPIEQPAGQETMTNEPTDPRAVRLAEINHSMAAFNKSRGFSVEAVALPGAPTRDLKRCAEIRLAALNASLSKQGGTKAQQTERRDLSYALQAHNASGMPIADALRQSGVDVSALLANFNKG
jgi:hypothetical protein